MQPFSGIKGNSGTRCCIVDVRAGGPAGAAAKLRTTPGIGSVDFGAEVVVRHTLAQQFIHACGDEDRPGRTRIKGTRGRYAGAMFGTIKDATGRRFAPVARGIARVSWRLGCDTPKELREQINDTVAKRFGGFTQILLGTALGLLTGLLAVVLYFVGFICTMLVRSGQPLPLQLASLQFVASIIVASMVVGRIALSWSRQSIAAVVVRHGACAACGYPLGGSTSELATCSECGAVWKTGSRSSSVERNDGPARAAE